MSHRRSVQISVVKKLQPLRIIQRAGDGSGVSPAQALGAGLGGHSSLQVLYLHGNRIGDNGLQALGRGKSIGADKTDKPP